MYNKLKIIKMFFGTILTILCIIGILQSCSYAATYVESEYKGNGEEIINKLIEDNFTGNTYSSDFETHLTACLNNLDNYNNISIRYVKGTGTYWTNTLNIAMSLNIFTLHSNNNTLSFTPPYVNYSFSNYRGSCSSNYTNQTNSYQFSINNYTSNDMACFVRKNQSNYWLVSNNSYLNINDLANLKFVPFNNNVTTIQGVSNIHLENFSRSVYEWRIGTLINFDSYTQGVFEMYQGENSQWVTINNVIAWNSNGEVYLTNNKLLYYQLYRVSFYDRDYNYTTTYGYYFLPIGETYSGESLIYNGNDNNNATPIINQMEENQNFWQQAYINLFTISGDYISNKFEEIREKYNISGDYEIEQSIINTIQNNANDFIISWEPLETHFSFGNYGQSTKQLLIPSGNINFSQMERENQGFHTSMEWARTIIGFSLGMLLLRNYWTTLMLTLGIGIQVYDKETQEKNAINQTITIDKNGKQTMTTTQKIGNLTIRRKK